MENKEVIWSKLNSLLMKTCCKEAAGILISMVSSNSKKKSLNLPKEPSRFHRTKTLKVKQGPVSGCHRSLFSVSVNLPVFPAELHLYEGFIGRQEERSLWKAGLQFVGLNKTKAEKVSVDWQQSARHLLGRIFQKWSPSDKGSTESLCEHLKHFANTLGAAHRRVVFSDQSQPLPIMVGEERKSDSKHFLFLWVPGW